MQCQVIKVHATTVTFSITDVDDTAPVITSGTTGTNLAENSGAEQDDLYNSSELMQ